MFTQYNPAGGIIPNHPIVHSIVNMERQIAELYGQLEAAGCTVTENHGELCVSVPHGVDIMPIMEKHREMFTKG